MVWAFKVRQEAKSFEVPLGNIAMGRVILFFSSMFTISFKVPSPPAIIMPHGLIVRINSTKSVFCGLLEIEERFELASEFDFYLSSDKDSIALFPICESCVDSILIEGAMSLPQKEEYVFV